MVRDLNLEAISRLIAIFARGFSRHRDFATILKSATNSTVNFMILVGAGLLGYFITLTDLPLQSANFLNMLDVSR